MSRSTKNTAGSTLDSDADRKSSKGSETANEKTIPIEAIVKRGHDWVYEENGKLKKFKPNQLIATCPSCLSGAIKWSDVRNKRQATTISELRCNRQAVGKCDHEDAKKRSEMRKRKADEDNPDGGDEQQDEPDSKLVKSETTSGDTGTENRERPGETSDHRKRKPVQTEAAVRTTPVHEIMSLQSGERELNPLDKLLQNVLPSHARELSAQLQAAGVAGAVASAAVSGSGPEFSIGGVRASNAYGRRSSPNSVNSSSTTANGGNGIPTTSSSSSSSSGSSSSSSSSSSTGSTRVRSGLGAGQSSASLLDLGPTVVKRDPEESPQRQSAGYQNVFDNLRLGAGDASGHHNVRSLHPESSGVSAGQRRPLVARRGLAQRMQNLASCGNCTSLIFMQDNFCAHCGFRLVGNPSDFLSRSGRHQHHQQQGLLHRRMQQQQQQQQQQADQQAHFDGRGVAASGSGYRLQGGGRPNILDAHGVQRSQPSSAQVGRKDPFVYSLESPHETTDVTDDEDELTFMRVHVEASPSALGADHASGSVNNSNSAGGYRDRSGSLEMWQNILDDVTRE